MNRIALKLAIASRILTMCLGVIMNKSSGKEVARRIVDVDLDTWIPASSLVSYQGAKKDPKSGKFISQPSQKPDGVVTRRANVNVAHTADGVPIPWDRQRSLPERIGDFFFYAGCVLALLVMAAIASLLLYVLVTYR